MKNIINKSITCITLITITLGSMGCSSTDHSVYYLGNKAYARNPQTGKIMSWEYKEPEGRGYKEYDRIEADLGELVCGILNCIVN